MLHNTFSTKIKLINEERKTHFKIAAPIEQKIEAYQFSRLLNRLSLPYIHHNVNINLLSRGQSFLHDHHLNFKEKNTTNDVCFKCDENKGKH